MKKTTPPRKKQDIRRKAVVSSSAAPSVQNKKDSVRKTTLSPVAMKLSKLREKIVRVSPPWLRKVGAVLIKPFARMSRRTRQLLRRRPHRSFRLTRRRDYKRSLRIQGYWSFTNYVRVTLWKNKRLFGGLMAVYFLFALAIGGFGQQDAYSNLSKTLTDAGGELFSGNWGQIGQAGLLLTTSITTGLTPSVTEAQSVLGGLVVFFTWLATVWALRNVLADRRVRVRESIYSSGAPVLPTVAVAFVLTLQLLPIAIAVLVYNAALYSGLISGGVEGMLLWIVLFLLGVLSLYWITSTIIALVVVTLPGMYPFQAIRTAGDLVIGRRLRILLRLVWAAVLTVIVWFLILIPTILFDAWVKKMLPAIEWIPTVPIALLLMSSITVVWLASYVYLLYRKVVDDDASPA
jgi:hypothetical protein